MLSRFLRQILFNLLHLVVSLLVAVHNVYHRYRVKIYDLFKEKDSNKDITFIKEHLPKLNKKLRHLVMLADTSLHSLNDLSQIVIWSLLAGIPYISFHDITGALKENEEKLFLEIERNKKGVPGCIKWSNKPDLNGYTNGIQANTVTINIFNYKDGRPKLAECVKRIAEGDIPCARSSSEYTAQELDKAISAMYPPIPDPDLVFYTGAFCCLHGLLPWQIRLTEFICLSLDHSISFDNYIDALYKYNKIDQRLGK